MRLWGLVLASALTAFFLNLANFLVTKRTSAVTLQVVQPLRDRISLTLALAPNLAQSLRTHPCSPSPNRRRRRSRRAQVLGNVKVVLSIGISLLVFGNQVSSWSVAGCLITLAGVVAYNRAPPYSPG